MHGMSTHPHQPSGPGATGGLPGTGSDTPDGTGFADGSTISEEDAASTIDEADVAPVGDPDTETRRP